MVQRPTKTDGTGRTLPLRVWLENGPAGKTTNLEQARNKKRWIPLRGSTLGLSKTISRLVHVFRTTGCVLLVVVFRLLCDQSIAGQQKC